MSFFTREQRYTLLCAVKHGQRHGDPLTLEEDQFIREYAQEKVEELLRDPECYAILDRLYESKWAHRFD